MKTNPPRDDRDSRLIVAVGVGALVLALILLVALLVDGAAEDDRGGSSRHCGAPVATVDPVTCLPYGRPGTGAAPGTNNSRSSTHKPAPSQPKAPPAVKAPAAPAVKAPRSGR